MRLLVTKIDFLYLFLKGYLRLIVQATVQLQQIPSLWLMVPAAVPVHVPATEPPVATAPSPRDGNRAAYQPLRHPSSLNQ